MNLNKHIYFLEQLTGKKVILIEKETFFIPQDLESRKEKYLQSIYRLLQQEVIDGDLEIEKLPIKDLGRVKRVNGWVEIKNCYNLKHLGYLDYVESFFYCDYNGLTTLKGAPKEVGGDFFCGHNELTSFEYLPEKIGEGLFISDNQLTTLEGCPKIINGDFSCTGNKLSSLTGCPKEVNGHFYLKNDIVQFTEEEIRAVCRVRGEVYC